MKRLFAGLLLFAAAMVSSGAESGVVPPIWPGPNYNPASNPKQYVFLTPKGDALIIYDPKQRGAEKRWVRIDLLNQARPKVTVKLSRRHDGMFGYLYTVANGSDAGNPIGTFAIVGYPGDHRLEMYHYDPEGAEERWRGQPPGHYCLIAHQVRLPGVPPGAYLRWFHHTSRDLIGPGKSLGGFWIKSSFRPGFTTGFVASGSFPRFGPARYYDVGHQLDFLNRTEWKDQPLLTMGPRYTPATPREVILKEFLLGIDQWIKSGNLEADSAFVQGLAGILQHALSNGGESKRDSMIPPAGDEYEHELLDAVRLSLKYGSGGEE